MFGVSSGYIVIELVKQDALAAEIMDGTGEGDGSEHT